MRAVTLLLQSSCQYMIISLAIKYFKSEPKRIQIIGFMLILNCRIAGLYQLLYNDSFIEFYNISCIYLAVRNKPVLAAVMISLSVSMKVGGVLLLPSLLGFTQYNNGTLKLLQAIFVILAIQVFLAGPFLSDTFCKIFGWT